MHALVTGAAGFIGSHLSQRLAAEGHTVRGVDSFTDYYDVDLKHRNLAGLSDDAGFELVVADLTRDQLAGLLEGIDVVFHQAGQPGVRLSWANDFSTYLDRNVLATQRLLEAVKDHPVDRLVYASSSSVYGNAASYPTTETDLPQPHSPYGVTKLAAEHLCYLYAENWGLSVAALRYFTVYGPRQRPDMAIGRFVDAIRAGRPVTVYGDGSQVRDFTYVGDVVDANLAAAATATTPPGPVNIAGGGSSSVNDLLDLIGESCGRPVERITEPAQPGDVRRTGGTTELARETLGWEPATSLVDGVAAHVEWAGAQENGST